MDNKPSRFKDELDPTDYFSERLSSPVEITEEGSLVEAVKEFLGEDLVAKILHSQQPDLELRIRPAQARIRALQLHVIVQFIEHIERLIFSFTSVVILKWMLSRLGVGKATIHERRSNRVSSPPGSTLLRLADFFCSPTTLQGCIRPTIADWREEYFQALGQNRRWKARWISIRSYYAIAKVFGLSKVLGIFKAVASQVRR